MEQIILMEGKMTPSKFKLFREEVGKCNQPESPCGIALVLSSGGGDISVGLPAVLELTKLQVPLRAKIYRAGSIAALAALIAPKREIVSHGALWIHLGNTVEIESNDIDAEGRIPQKARDLLTQYRSICLEYLRKASPMLCADTKMWNKLLASNRLELNATECLKYGLVDRIV